MPFRADTSRSVNMPYDSGLFAHRAYKRLALQLHPDKQQQQQGAGSKPDQDAAAVAAAAEEFVRVAAAYKLLMEKLG